jgi:filamentous hemagglutinin
LGENIAALLPFYGTPIALYQAIGGQSLTGTDLSTTERFFNGVAAAIPVGSGAYKLINSAMSDFRLATSMGGIAADGKALMDLSKLTSQQKGVVGELLGANAGTKVAGAIDDAALTGRPTPRQSEIDVGMDLPPGARPQVSFKNGQEAPYGTSGSVRPDYCLGNVCSVEVKNYNIATNSNGLVSNVSQQAIDRAANLPPGMTQTVVIDIRGQTVTTQQLDAIRLQIVQRSNGAVSPNNIRFKDK